MNNLTQYGWNEWLAIQKQNSPFNTLEHGRITITHKTCYEVISEKGVFTCELTGNLLFASQPSDYPCTGDWVIFQPFDHDKGIIVHLLPRLKTLYRLKNGTLSEKQIIASHVDKAFIVQSLDIFFNVRRIERFMIQMANENIQPILVLSKSDLTFDKNFIENELKHIASKIPIFYTSNQQPETINNLRKSISAGETVVLIGMSGSGKSTLINLIFGSQLFKTSEISASTGKGKHTSTRRELVLIPDSGVLIDTPGVKLFGVTNDDTDSLSEMLDIGHFERQCLFSDCKHINEKGCAVINAVEKGIIEPGVYENYLKLRREAWHFTASVHEKRQYEKSFSKMVKEFKKKKF